MDDKPTKMVAYYRLSKPKKGKNKNETIRDAYGLEDQRREVARLAEKYGATLIGEFPEIETGTNKKARRPELEKAILLAQMHKATLVIGKLDRLARNTHFVTGLMEKKVKFMCANAPEQDETMIELSAVMAAKEARDIGDRTKRALRIAKEQGVKLGSARPGHWKGREHLRGFKQATAASAIARKRRVREAYQVILELIVKWQAEGVSYDVIAERLNARNYMTLGNKPFRAPSVLNVMRLFGKEPVKRPFVLRICSKCHLEVRVPADRDPDLPIICHRCEDVAVSI